MLYVTSSCLIYIITVRLYLLISFTYFTYPPTLLNPSFFKKSGKYVTHFYKTAFIMVRILNICLEPKHFVTFQKSWIL